MSRLDSAIRRLVAQRDCLGLAVAATSGLPGPVIELGLGNGRTFDHLRSIAPDREIFVFDRQVRAHPDCIPDPAHLFLGDLRDTLPVAVERLGGTATLLHSDIGTGDPDETAALVAQILPWILKLVRPNAVIASDQPLGDEALDPMPLPEGVNTGRYFLYRAGNCLPIVPVMSGGGGA